MKQALAMFVFALAVHATSPASSSTGYHIVKKIPVPGDGGFDYLTVDDAARRLYVSHGTKVDVIDIDAGTVAGSVPNTKGVHGIAIAQESGHGFATDGTTSAVTVFDLKGLKSITEVKTGEGPDAIVYDPATRRVFAYNGEGESATVIDSASAKVAGTIELGGSPEFSAADGKGNVFVNLENKNMVVKLDSRKLTIVARWPLARCESPSSMAIDRSNHRLFIGCRNHLLAIVDTGNGQVISTAPIGDHVDATAYDVDRGLIFNSCGDGTIWIFHQDSPDKYTHVQTVQTQPGAKTMALDPKTHDLFLSAAEFGPKPASSAKGRGPIKSGSFTVLVVGR
jgi:DNA-binding beta-propeller fold protein YncE